MKIQNYTDAGNGSGHDLDYVDDELNIASLIEKLHERGVISDDYVNSILQFGWTVVPKPTVDLKSCWVHTNGNEYIVQLIVNVDSTNDKYPPTVVYKNAHNGKGYSRPLCDWHRSMTRYKVKSDE